MREVDNGLMSPYRYLTEIEGLDEEDAKAELQRINEKQNLLVDNTVDGE